MGSMMADKNALQVNIHDAKTHLSRYLARAAAGETVIIARAGKPIAKLTAVDDPPKARKSIIGAMKGEILCNDETFNAMDEEIACMFFEDADKPL